MNQLLSIIGYGFAGFFVLVILGGIWKGVVSLVEDIHIDGIIKAKKEELYEVHQREVSQRNYNTIFPK